MRRYRGLLLIALVVSCGGSGEPGPGDTTTPSSVTAVTSTVASPTTQAATSTEATTTSTEPPPPAIGAELLVAGPDGIFVVDPDGGAVRIVAGPAVFAVDDLAGGVLFQQERWTKRHASTVYRVRSGTATAIEILVAASDQGLALHGVVGDGDGFVYYSRNEGSTPEDVRVTLRRYSLQTREVSELETTGGWEWSTFPVSLGGNLVLLNWYAEAAHGMDFLDLSGNTVAVAANPSPEDGFADDYGPSPDYGELSADGTELAFYEVVDGVGNIVIRHVASGAEIRRIEVESVNRWSVVSLDLASNHLVVNRRDGETALPAYVYDLGQVDPDAFELPVAGEAYLTQSRVALSGEVPAP